MVSIDLVTGFLGAGKTTFIDRYCRWLQQQGVRFAVVENEFGAAGVDTAILSDRFDNVLELAGGCICCTLKSGFYQLLEQLCTVCDRIVVEPSGLYNLDDFFEVADALELRGLARAGMCITLIDPHTLPVMNDAEKDVLRDELLGSGGVVWTKADAEPAWDEETARAQVQACLGQTGQPMSFYETPSHLLCGSDFSRLQGMTPQRRAHTRVLRDHRAFYQSTSLRPAGCFEPEKLISLLREILRDGSCGEILRVKGFVQSTQGSVAVNCTVSDYSVRPCSPQPVMLNVIGRGLDRACLKAKLAACAVQEQQA